MNVSLVFTIAAIICFILAALSVSVGGLLLVPIGLALFAAGHLPI
jgi:hypothetical protein